METIKKWVYKNLENIVIGYLTIAIIFNSIFYLLNFDSISQFYFNLFLVESVILIIAFGYFLLNYKTKEKIDTKGYAYAFLVFSFLTRSATFINYILYFSVHNKYNFDFKLPIATYIFPILLLLVIILSYKKKTLPDLISNKRNNFNIYIIGMYLIDKLIHIPYKVMIDVSDDNYFTMNYFGEILKNFIEFDGYFVIFTSVTVFILPVAIMFILNIKFDKHRKRSFKYSALIYLSVFVLAWLVGQYGLYFYLGIMTGYQRDLEVIFEIIRRIEYIYIVLFITILVIKNRYND